MAEDWQATWENEEDEPVEVNQRALIHKILARYPGEFTMFRELLQNSDDAKSSTVEIHFETTTPGETLDQKSSDLKVAQITFKNDGEPFTKDDWNRLAKIAEGNPNSAAVGAFGVGFYSVFSVTDCPLVLSGGRGMQFYWKDNKDQLHIRKGTLSSETLTDTRQGKPPQVCTSFKLQLREPGPVPQVVDFMRFLATSITFMAHLTGVSIWVNHHCIGSVKKLFLVPAEVVKCPVSLRRSSPLKTMNVRVDKIQCLRFTVQVEITHAAFLVGIPEPQNPTRPCIAKQGLTVFSVLVDVEEDEQLMKEAIRSTGKKPPSWLKYSLVYTGKEEYDRSIADQDNPLAVSIFQRLRADLKGALYSRIFIGHSTSQTTGIGGHMASRFIPTVERESIDLVNAPIWNNELLFVGGLLSRAVYELELSAIQALWEKSVKGAPDLRPSAELQKWLREGFVHILKFFTFHHSTPSPSVARLLQKSFYECSDTPLRLLSSVGVRHAPDIRLFNQICARFLKYVPMLSQEVSRVGDHVIEALPGKHQIRDTTLSDVLDDLNKHILDEGELVACLQWLLNYGSVSDMKQLSQVARFWSAGKKELQLSAIRCFIDSNDPSSIPLDGPLPEFLMPLKVTDRFDSTQLRSFGWRKLTIIDWLQYISLSRIRSASSEFDFTRSPRWAERVLNSVCLALVSSQIPADDRALWVFRDEKCIPTISGLHRPQEAYLPIAHVRAFDDLNLPIVRFPSGREISTEMELLLLAVGVRGHLPPNLILAQMVKTDKWGTPELVDYLVQVANLLSPADFTELRSLEAFTAKGVQKDIGKMRFRADELYPPIENFRQLQLPLIEWEKKTKWRDESPEAKILYHLGLRRHPSLDEIRDRCSSQNAAVNASAFEYLCANLRTVYMNYNPEHFWDVAFVQAEKEGKPCLEKPGNVFLDDHWKILRFSVIRHKHLKDVIKELGVQRHPSPALLLDLLGKEPPSSEEVARQWFEILSEHGPSFSQQEVDTLSRLQIVPKTISEHLELLAPVRCYVGRSMGHDFYSKLFHFVNFGPKANSFLSACGAKIEPSENDVAESLVDNPRRFYDLAGGPERFLQEVGVLASRHTRIPNCTINKMRTKSVLLGVQRETTSPERWETNYLLWEPGEIVIVDDIQAYQLFGDSVIAAPRDMPPELERFYVLLGCRHLSTAVSEQCSETEEIIDPETCSYFRDLVVDRFPLFLQHYPNQQPEMLVFWPSSPNDIVVRLWDRLSVSKTFHSGDTKTSKDQDVWATAKYEDGKIQLWLSNSAKQDMYEIAIALCRVLLGAVKLSDALLLTTILSEELDVLKRRGYEVEQVIKRQQQANDLNTTDPANPCCPIMPDTSCTLPNTSSATKMNHDPMPTQPTTNPSSLHGNSKVAQGTLAASIRFPLHSVTNVINNARSAIHGATSGIMSDVKPSGTGAPVLPPVPLGPGQVMTQSYIQTNVKKAIRLCRSGARTLLHHDRSDIAEFFSKGYCDVTKPMGHPRFLGEKEGIKVCIHQAIPASDKFMQDKDEMLTLFTRVIIIPIAKIYGLPAESVHIFYNDTAGCIAFNKKGTLYLNLLYFEVWHYQAVKNDKPQQALSSWFLTFAHEIAHNLVLDHNAEHEFWSLNVSEAHMDEFSKLLVAVSVGGSRVVETKGLT